MTKNKKGSVKEWLENKKNDKNFSKQIASKAISEIMGKAKSPKSLKVKIKF